MATKTTTLAPPSLSSVLKSNTIQSAPQATATTSSSSTASSNAAKLAAIRAANQAKQSDNTGVIITGSATVKPKTEIIMPGTFIDYGDGRYGGTAGDAIAQAKANDIATGRYTNTPITTPKTTTPRTPTATSETINGVRKTYVPRINTKSFTDAIGTARSRADYDTGINYARLDPQSKKIADRYYDQASKTGKLLPPKDMYEERMDVETQEARKTREMLERQKKEMADAEKNAMEQENAAIDESMAADIAERDTFIAEQEGLAKDTETNRLNQVRGNIMQSLASRGVDISKLSPEQIVALSGEQGAKAFMDITDVREKVKSNIKQARDTALSRIKDLRQRKAISSTAYERNIANINSQAEAAQLNADRNASAQIFALTQTKIEQGRTDATQRANAVTNIASMLGLSGPQIAPVLNLINTTGTGPEQLVETAKMISNPESPLRKSLDANMSAAQQAALQKQLLDEYKAETARITASRARSSGGGGLTTAEQIEMARRQGAVADSDLIQ